MDTQSTHIDFRFTKAIPTGMQSIANTPSMVMA